MINRFIQRLAGTLLTGCFSFFICMTGNGQKIAVSPSNDLLFGQDVHIKLDHLTPHSAYSVTAEISDEWHRTWHSNISFVADAKGSFDLWKDAPVAGTYSGVDKTGLFWSAILEPKPPTIPKEQQPFDKIVAHICLISGKDTVDRRTITRWLARESTRKTEIRENGLVATLYRPPLQKKSPAVIFLGGSGGGMVWSRVTGSAVSSYGCTTLALGYFKFETLPAKLEKIPLEYIRKAIDFLKRQPFVDTNKIYVAGWSIGAQLALLSASYMHEIKGVIGFAPSHVLYQSYAPPDFPKTSTWTYHGAELPFVPFVGYSDSVTNNINFLNYLKDKEAEKRAVIPVENIKGRILLFAGKDDLTWPSEMMSVKVMERLKNNHFRYSYRTVYFDSAGHNLVRAGYMPTTVSTNEGGTAKANAHAQYTSFREMIGFIFSDGH